MYDHVSLLLVCAESVVEELLIHKTNVTPRVMETLIKLLKLQLSPNTRIN
jgi:hypothetical protein